MTLTLQTTVRAPLGEAPDDLTEAAIVARFTGGAYPSTIVARFAASVLLHARLTRIRASIVAAQIAKETGNFRFGGQVAPSQFNLAGIGATNDGAAGIVATSIEIGVAMVFAHHLNYLFGAFDRWPAELAAYQRYAVRNAAVVGAGYGGVVTTIGSYSNGRWAWSPQYPKGSLDNGYATGIVAIGNALLGQEAASAAKGGKVTVQKPTVTSKPSPNRGYGGADYKPEAIVWHITAGSGASAVSWLTNPASNASANYVVLESGETVELVNPEAGANGAAWANGDVQKPDLTNPLIAGWVKADINPNLRVCSIEHAGQSSAGKGGSLTPAQIEATVRLTAWLCQRFGIAPDQDHILGHYQINDVTRHNCPGFSAAEWSAWVGRIAALVRGAGTSDTDIGGTIAGGLGKVPVAPAAQGGIMARYIDTPGEGVYPGTNEAGEPFVIIKPGGKMKEGTVTANIQNVGVSGEGTDGAMYDRSVLNNAWGEYNRRPKS